MTFFIIGVDMAMFSVSTLSGKNGIELLLFIVAVHTCKFLKGNNCRDLDFKTLIISFNTAKHG